MWTRKTACFISCTVKMIGNALCQCLSPLPLCAANIFWQSTNPPLPRCRFFTPSRIPTTPNPASARNSKDFCGMLASRTVEQALAHVYMTFDTPSFATTFKGGRRKGSPFIVDFRFCLSISDTLPSAQPNGISDSALRSILISGKSAKRNWAECILTS